MGRRILLGILVAATAVGGLFLGMLARDSSEKIEGVAPPSSLFTPGAAFPDVPLLGEDELTHSTHDILGREGGVVIFMALGCHPCEVMSLEWDKWRREGKLEGIRLFGITRSPLHLIKSYRENHHIGFPIYSDSTATFSTMYQVQDYPLRLVVDRENVVRYATFDAEEPVDPESVRNVLR